MEAFCHGSSQARGPHAAAFIALEKKRAAASCFFCFLHSERSSRSLGPAGAAATGRVTGAAASAAAVVRHAGSYFRLLPLAGPCLISTSTFVSKTLVTSAAMLWYSSLCLTATVVTLSPTLNLAKGFSPPPASAAGAVGAGRRGGRRLGAGTPLDGLRSERWGGGLGRRELLHDEIHRRVDDSALRLARVLLGNGVQLWTTVGWHRGKRICGLNCVAPQGGTKANVADLQTDRLRNLRRPPPSTSNASATVARSLATDFGDGLASSCSRPCPIANCNPFNTSPESSSRHFVEVLANGASTFHSDVAVCRWSNFFGFSSSHFPSGAPVIGLQMGCSSWGAKR